MAGFEVPTCRSNSTVFNKAYVVCTYIYDVYFIDCMPAGKSGIASFLF